MIPAPSPDTIAAGVIALTVASTTLAQTPSFTVLTIPGVNVRAAGISADGRTVTGSLDGNSERGAFSWNASGGFNTFGRTLGPNNAAGAVSADGTVIVGNDPTPAPNSRNRAFRRVGNVNSYIAMPTGFTGSVPTSVSRDGRVVGGLIATDFSARAARSIDGAQFQDLGVARPEHRDSQAFGMSGDGRYLYGRSGNLFGNTEAVRWSESAGWEVLARPSGFPSSLLIEASTSSFDGSVVVGQINGDGAGVRANGVVWRNGVPTILPLFTTGQGSVSTGNISDDGSIIVGTIFDPVADRDTGCLWINDQGPIRVDDYLRSNNVPVPSDWIVTSLSSLSADGRTFLGRAVLNGERVGFIATVPTPSTLFYGIGFFLAVSRRHRYR
jgi:uncharacterized membrane protein